MTDVIRNAGALLLRRRPDSIAAEIWNGLNLSYRGAGTLNSERKKDFYTPFMPVKTAFDRNRCFSAIVDALSCRLADQGKQRTAPQRRIGKGGVELWSFW